MLNSSLSAFRNRSPVRCLTAAALVAGLALIGSGPSSAQGLGEVVRIGENYLPPENQCTTDPEPVPPSQIHVGDYGRLTDSLRATASWSDPLRSLSRGALFQYYARSARREDVLGVSRGGWAVRARAYADLAVSGRQSYEELVSLGLTRDELALRVRRALAADATLFGLGTLSATRVTAAVDATIDRAYTVAWVLRGPVETRESYRANLGWIAVSGEEDRPHRPVNMTSAPYPQRDLTLTIDGRPLTVRAVFMNPSIQDWPASAALDTERLPTPQPIPTLRGDIVVFMHGHASTAEEALSLAPELFAAARARNREITLLSLDLPGYGYSTTLDTAARFPRLPMDGVPNVYPGLDFLDGAIDAIIAHLEELQPGTRHRAMGVIGGSLGGNLGLRLAGRDMERYAYPWMKNVVSWSPASVWPSFAASCENRTSAERCGLGDIFSDNGQRRIGLRTTLDMIGDEYHEGKRGNFYSGDPLQKGSQFSRAGKWFRDAWPCKDAAIKHGKWSTGEYFSEDYLPWHWRIAHEQLVFSHWDPPQALMGRYETYPKLLMIAPEDDDDKPEYLYTGAVRLGEWRNANYGWTLDVATTGHSIHAERPVFLARQIVDFMYRVPEEIIITVTD